MSDDPEHLEEFLAQYLAGDPLYLQVEVARQVAEQAFLAGAVTAVNLIRKAFCDAPESEDPFIDLIAAVQAQEQVSYEIDRIANDYVEKKQAKRAARAEQN